MSPKKAATTTKDGKKKRTGGGLTKPMKLSKELSDVCGGVEVESRAQIVKRLHQYFRENNCKDPKDGRNIILDEKLKKVFPVQTMTVFSMNKYIGAHLTKIEEE